MPNAYWNNQHGANRTSPAGASNAPAGSKSRGGVTLKTANWPGVPGKTQSRDRSAGVPKRGKKGEFAVKKVGL